MRIVDRLIAYHKKIINKCEMRLGNAHGVIKDQRSIVG